MRLEDTLNLMDKPASIRAPSAATAMADRQRAIRRTATPVRLVAQRMVVEDHTPAEDRMEAVAAEEHTAVEAEGITKAKSYSVQVDRGI